MNTKEAILEQLGKKRIDKIESEYNELIEKVINSPFSNIPVEELDRALLRNKLQGFPANPDNFLDRCFEKIDLIEKRINFLSNIQMVLKHSSLSDDDVILGLIAYIKGILNSLSDDLKSYKEMV